MAETTPSETIAEISTAAAMFPDAKSIFGISLKPIQSIKDSCIVVLDTNVLLVPYTINPKGLDEIAKAYRSLRAENRLVIPGQVAREFAKNRPSKLTELYQQLSVKKSKLQPFQKGQYPLLESLAEYSAVVESEKTLDELVAKYRDSISKLLDKIRGWTWNDPVSLLYAELFTADMIVEAEISKEALEADIKRRLQFKIPPGYKDASKDDAGAGDILIWHTILELGKRDKKDIIFVSADGKPDWFHQSDGPLYPRFELVDEFRRNSGASSFHILKFSDFLDLFGAGDDVVEEVRIEEAKLTPPEEPERLQTKGRGFLAEAAVGRWLLTRFPGSLVERKDSHLDYELVKPDGQRLGVIVKVVLNPLMWKQQVVKMTEKNVARGESEISDVLVCLVVEGQESAALLAQHFMRRESRFGSVEVCIGWLDTSNSFVPAANIQF